MQGTDSTRSLNPPAGDELPGRAGGVAAGIEFRALGPDLAVRLGLFFESLRVNGDERFFHPHPLTHDEAVRRCADRGLDLYYAAVSGSEVLAYGMLRGWSEGYAVPSLGIAVAPAYRGCGLARPFMAFLHAAARWRGAPAVRLKVYEANTAARELYRSLGYRYEPAEGAQLLGVLNLSPRR
jgi:ribosomal protein S18 acetylase RimI-like enzyme